MSNNIKEVLEQLKFDTHSFHNGSWDYADVKPEVKALLDIKRIIEEAKPTDYYKEFSGEPIAIAWNNSAKQYHENLLKALGE